MASGNRIDFTVGFNVDREGLRNIQASLQSLQRITTTNLMDINRGMNLQQANDSLNQLRGSIGEVQRALKASFNERLNSFNITELNNQLKNLDLNKIYDGLSKAGQAGTQVFRDLSGQILTTNLGLKESHGLAKKMMETFANTIRWQIATTAINTITGSIQQAYGYAKNLDTSLNNIRIVTGKSAEEMSDFAKKANEAAKALGSQTKNYSDAALIYFQQGLNNQEAQARADVTVKAANVTGQTSAEVSEQLTAVWNGYKVAAQETELYVDKLAAVAATTASDLEELSVGMSKVASAAASMGVDVDQLNAMMSTIISVTRQAPESVGTALKTIFARIGDLEVEGQDEFGVTLGDVSSTLEKVGIQILDEQENLRDIGAIVEEVAGKWQKWTEAQRQAVAIAMAGKRQYNNLFALFDNMDMYTEAIETSKNAVGTLQEQQDIYMESTQGKLKTLGASLESVYGNLFNSKDINGIVDGIVGIVDSIASLVERIEGLKGILPGLGALFLNVFSQKISKSIVTMSRNFLNIFNNVKKMNAQKEILNMFGDVNQRDPVVQKLTEMKQQIINLGPLVSEQQHNIANALIQGRKAILDQQSAWNAMKESAENFYNTLQPLHEQNELLNFNALRGLDNDNLERVANNIRTGLNDIKASFAGADSSVDSFTNSINDLRAAADRNSLDTQEMREGYEGLGIVMNEYITTLKSVQNAEGITTAQREKFIQEIQNFETAYNRVRGNLTNIDTSTMSEEQRMGATIFNSPEVLGAARRVVEAFRQAGIEIQGSVTQTLDTLEAELRGRTQNFENMDESMNDRFQDHLRETGEVARTELVVKTIAALGQLAFALQNMKGLIKTLADDSIDGEEKSEQAFSSIVSLLLTIPGIITNIKESFSQLVAVVGGTAAKVLGGIGLLLTAVGFVWSGITTYQKQLEKNARELRDNTIERIKELQQERDAVQTLYESYSSAYTEYKRTGEGKEELKEATKALCEQMGDEIDVLDLMADKYDVINEKIEKNRALQIEEGLTDLENRTRQEHLNLIQDFYSAYNDKYKGSYKFDFSKEFYREEEYIRQFYNTVQAYLDELNPKIKLEFFTEDKSDMLYKSYAGIISAGNMDGVQDVIDLYEAISKAQSDFLSKNSDNAEALNSDVAKKWNKFLNDYSEIYNELKELQNSNANQILQSSEIAAQKALGFSASDIQSIEEYEKFRNSYIDFFEEMQTPFQLDYTSEEIENMADIYLSSFENLPDLIQEFNVKEKIAEQTNAGEEEIKDFFDWLNQQKNGYEILLTVDFDQGDSIEDFKALVQESVDSFNSQLSENAISSLGAAISSISDEGDLSGLDEEMSSLFNSTMKSLDGIKSNISAQKEWETVSKQGSLAQIEYLQDLLTQQALNNSELEKGIEQQKKAESERLKGFYRDLEAEASVLKKSIDAKKDALSHAYKQEDRSRLKLELEELEDKLSDVSEQAQKTRYSFESLDKEVKNKDFDFEINMTGIDNIESIADSIFEQTENIKNAAELIGEGYKVAADDARELMNILPEIFEQSEVLADGQIQLNQDVVESIISGQKDIVEGDVEKTAQLIDAQIKQLEGAIELEEAKIQLAFAADREEIDLDANAIKTLSYNRSQLTKFFEGEFKNQSKASEAAAAAMSGNIEEFNEITKDVGSDIAVNVGNAVASAANATKINAEIMAKNLAQVGVSAAQAAEAVAAIGSSRVSTVNGEIYDDRGFRLNKEYIVGNFLAGAYSNSYSPTRTAGAFVGKNFEDFYNPSDIKDPELRSLVENSLADIGSYRAGINRLNSLKQALRASSGDTKKALDNIGKGKDGSGSGKNKDGGKKDENSELDYIEMLEDESDIYHDINIEIQKISNSLTKLQNQEKRLIGKDLIKNLEQQLKLLKQQEKSYETKLKLMNLEKKNLKGMLSGYGIEFNDDGSIKNYFKRYKIELDKINEVRKRYNEAGSKEEQEKIKEEMEAMEQSFENFKNLVENYDTLTTETIPEFQETIKDLADEEIELKIKKARVRLDVSIDTGEFFRKLKDFQKEVIKGIQDTDYLKSAKFDVSKIQSYFNKGGEIELSQARLEDAIKKYQNATNKNKSQYYEDMINEAEEYMDMLSEVKSLLDEIEEAYFDMFEAAQSAFDTQNDIYDAIRSQNEHDKNLMELIYGDEAYDKMEGYYKRQNENNKKQLNMRKQEVNFARKRLEEAKKLNDETEKEKQFKEKAIAEANENLRNAESNLNEALIERVQNIYNQYENGINLAIKNFKKTITDGLGLDNIENEWKLINQEAEQYLDTVNKQYEIQKLQSKYDESLNNSNSIFAQNKLTKIMEKQLKALKEKDKLSQYEIERANLLFELTLKQIALEDAQNNKTKMRLRRDSQGNYNYQFVADEEQILKAEQELREKQQELYNKDKEEFEDTSEQIQNLINSFSSDLLEATNEKGEEERAKKMADIYKNYGKIIDNEIEKSKVARENLMESTLIEYAKMNNLSYEQVLAMSEKEKNIIMKQMIPTWETGTSKMIDFIIGRGGLSNATEDLQKEILSLIKISDEDVKKAIEEADRTMEDYTEGTNKVNEELKEQLNTNSELIKQYNTEFKDYMQDIYLNYNKISKALEETGKEAENTFKKVNKLNKELLKTTLEPTEEEKKSTISKLAKKVVDKGLNTTIKEALGKDEEYKNLSKEDKEKLKKEVTALRKNKKKEILNSLAEKVLAAGSNSKAKKVLKDNEDYKSLTEAQKEELNKLIEEKRKSLSEKKENTKKQSILFSDVSSVYDFDKSFTKQTASEKDLKDVSIENGLSIIPNFLSGLEISSFSPIISLATKANTPNEIQQRVYIEANYPNVHDAKEIENALNNLTNIASQYAYST